MSTLVLPDIQQTAPTHAIAINWVGVRGLRYSMQTAVTKFRFMRARRKFKVHEGGRGPTVH